MIDDESIQAKYRGYNPAFVRRVLARKNKESKSPNTAKDCTTAEGIIGGPGSPNGRVPGVPQWVSDIVVEVAAAHGLDPGALMGKSRQRRVVTARNEALYRIRRNNTRLSYAKIGLWFPRDHTAVMLAVATHARRNGLPDITGFDLEGHNAARARFAEKRRRRRLSERVLVSAASDQSKRRGSR